MIKKGILNFIYKVDDVFYSLFTKSFLGNSLFLNRLISKRYRWLVPYDVYDMKQSQIMSTKKAIKKVIEWSLEDLPKGKKLKILDPCCGDGRYLKEFGLRGFKDLTAYEISPYLRKLVKKMLRYPKVKNKDFLLDEVKESFDIIAFGPPFLEYHHIPPEKRKQYKDRFEFAQGNYNISLLFLEKCLKLLKPSGKLICTMKEGIFLNHKKVFDEIQKRHDIKYYKFQSSDSIFYKPLHRGILQIKRKVDNPENRKGANVPNTLVMDS